MRLLNKRKEKRLDRQALLHQAKVLELAMEHEDERRAERLARLIERQLAQGKGKIVPKRNYFTRAISAESGPYFLITLLP